VGERVGLGRGRTDFGWNWNRGSDVRRWESSIAHFVPYSHVLPRRRELRGRFMESQDADFKDFLGGLYTVPSDQRLAFVFQEFDLKQERYDLARRATSEFMSFMEILTDFGGSFTIRDFDDTHHGEEISQIRSGAALYGYKGGVLKATAQDAEEYFVNIPPIRLDKETGTSPWRRLMQVEPYLQCSIIVGTDISFIASTRAWGD
jgi:hypothetical protein